MDSIKTRDTIGIILCTYNGEKYIARQIESILNQTDKNWHLIISDDASSDGTVEILRHYRDENPDKIELIIRKDGFRSACKHFLRMIYTQCPKYDYIMCADQDDIWKSDKVEISRRLMHKAEKKYGSDMPILIHTDSNVVDEDENVIAHSFLRYQNANPKNNTLNHLLVQNIVTGASMIINKPLSSLLDPPPENVYMHDAWMALIASCFGVILYSDRKTYMYRQHESNFLGANKAGLAKEILHRITDGSADKKSKDNYAKLYEQAKDFRNIYKGSLTANQLEVLDAFIAMQDMNRLEKIKNIIRYRFTYNTTYRTIGECIYI